MADFDSVGDNYYKPAARLDRCASTMFYFAAALSLALPAFNWKEYPKAHNNVETIFIVCVVILFLLNQAQWLYFFPRAEDARRRQLLSDALGVSLTHEKTQGYYNTIELVPMRRLAASTMESAFFTYSILRSMLVWKRASVLIYLVVYLFAVTRRETDLAIISVIAQVIFGEEIVSRWFRMEWLRFKSEQAYEQIRDLFAWKKSEWGLESDARVIAQYSSYECAKYAGAILLSSAIFVRRNPELSDKWNHIRAEIGI